MDKYRCENFDECRNYITYNKRGRKPKRCKKCQQEYSKRLRRNAYREKVKDNVKVTSCKFKLEDDTQCNVSIPYVTRRPDYCPKHARIIRTDWMEKHYAREKIFKCGKCGRPIKYETKKPELCPICRARDKIQRRRLQIKEMSNGICKDTQKKD